MLNREMVEGLFTDLSAAVEAALLEGPDSGNAMAAAVTFHHRLEQARGLTPDGVVKLEMRMSLFVHGARALTDASIRGRSLIAFMRRVQSGGLAFGKGVAPASVAALLRCCCASLTGEDDAATRRTASEIPGVVLLAPLDDVRWQFVDDPATQAAYQQAGFDVTAAAPLRQDMAVAVEDAVAAASAGEAVDMNLARTRAEEMIQAVDDGFDNLLQLAERPEFDVFTVQHSLRVSLFATYVATQLGAPHEFLIELGAASMFHDVGKGRIPDEVLYKPGRLDDDERRVMSMHPELGASILLDSDDVSPLALGAAYGHHLRFDGKGYPERRPWYETTRATSLIQICDVFEALTSRRPYKAPYSPARAFQILYSDPGAFDPTLLAAFTRALGLYPPGRFVLLKDGRLGRVVRAGRTLDRPVVRTFPRGEVLVLGAPENAHVHVDRLLEEPEFVQLLMSGVSADALARMAPTPAPAVTADTNEPVRDDEFADLKPRTGVLIPPDGCDHGPGCRLC